MKRLAAIALVALAAACSPSKPAAPETQAAAPQAAGPGPEATVTAIYKTLVESKGQKSTPVSDIPMSADLDALIKKLEAASPSDGGAPPFDGDMAGNCQDCSDFADLKVEPSKATAAPGHTLIDAHFTLFKKEQHTVTWDMVQAPEGWRVDNIVSDGFDARKIANEGIADAKTASDAGAEEVECVVLIAKQIETLTVAKAPKADIDKLQAASDSMRRKATASYTKDEYDQLFASTVAVNHATPAAEVKSKADACVAKAK